jgi:ElaB/YqjD/DUF883 family membrane-anchored ribosome-binding protein
MSDSITTATDQIQLMRKRLKGLISDGQEMIENVNRSIRRQAGRTDHAIRANPYRSLAIASGVGLVAGLLLSRRNSR